VRRIHVRKLNLEPDSMDAVLMRLNEHPPAGGEGFSFRPHSQGRPTLHIFFTLLPRNASPALFVHCPRFYGELL